MNKVVLWLKAPKKPPSNGYALVMAFVIGFLRGKAARQLRDRLVDAETRLAKLEDRLSPPSDRPMQDPDAPKRARSYP